MAYPHQTQVEITSRLVQQCQWSLSSYAMKFDYKSYVWFARQYRHQAVVALLSMVRHIGQY